MALTTPRLRREALTMRRMVEIYCPDHHADAPTHPCAECETFLAYAERRLEKCPYGEGKPTCANCPIHCYKRAQRAQAKAIMRYAGPRMTWRHPWLALLHLTDKLRRVAHPGAGRSVRSVGSGGAGSGGAGRSGPGHAASASPPPPPAAAAAHSDPTSAGTGADPNARHPPNLPNLPNTRHQQRAEQ